MAKTTSSRKSVVSDSETQTAKPAAAKPASGNPWDQMMANAAEVASTFRKRPQVKVSSPWREGFGRPLSQRSREIYEHITANKTRLKQKD